MLFSIDSVHMFEGLLSGNEFLTDINFIVTVGQTSVSSPSSSRGRMGRREVDVNSHVY